MIQYDVLIDLIEIKTSENKTLLHDLVGIFSKQTPERLIQIGHAIKQNNKEIVSRTAHTLRSSCSYLGALEMAGLCEKLESWSTQPASDNHDEALIYLSAIEDSFEESIEELNKYVEVLH